jgi:hypothetical protein
MPHEPGDTLTTPREQVTLLTKIIIRCSTVLGADDKQASP